MSKVSGGVTTCSSSVIWGVNVYPAEVECVLLADGRVAPHYVLVVDAREAVKELVVAVEPRTAHAPGHGPDHPIAGGLECELRDQLGLRARVGVLARGTLRGPRWARRCGWSCVRPGSRRRPA